MDKEDYLIFASDLEKYELEDIEAGLNAIPPRRDGQTAFPDVDTIKEAVRVVIRARKPTADQLAKMAWDAYVEKCKAENIEGPDPEIKALIDKLNARLSL